MKEPDGILHDGLLVNQEQDGQDLNGAGAEEEEGEMRKEKDGSKVSGVYSPL